MMQSKYQRAEQLLPWNLSPKFINLTIEPCWLDIHRFWFKRDLKEGYEFILIDGQQLTQAPAFDHERLAVSLSQLLHQQVNSKRLPVITFDVHKENQYRLVIDHPVTQGKAVLLDRENYSCCFDTDIVQTVIADAHISVISPGGESDVIMQDHNLVLRNRKTGHRQILTEDGEEHSGYGSHSDFIRLAVEKPSPPAVIWSPDGRYLAIQRIEERQVEDVVIMHSVGEQEAFRPECQTFKMAYPGDKHLPMASLCVIDLESERLVSCDRPPVAAPLTGGAIECGAVYWGDNNHLYYVEWTRDRQTHRLVGFDYVSGTSTVIIEESDQGFSGPWLTSGWGEPLIRVLPKINQVIWYSRRSGWGHLYLYDLSTGEVINAITEGDYVVTAIHCVDTEKNRLFFSACGRELGLDPYFELLYRVDFDGANLTLLTPEASQHDIRMPEVYGPDLGRRVFVDTISRVDQPPRSVLRSADDGAELMTLSEFDNTLLSSTPYTSPLPFTAKASDGDTDLWGVIYRPSDFDESKTYPVILLTYATPASCITPKRYAQLVIFSGAQFYYAPPMAELGFIIVVVEPRGTPLRSKAFHDIAYSNLKNGGGMDDQVEVLKQLGKKYSWMDLERVGITGFSGGGFSSARAMLSHSDFFKVAVSNAGNHDQRIHSAGWAEPFQGLLEGDNYKEQASVHLAKNLKGKLLLTHGERDTNVHIAHTLQLVDKLIEHNKDFDLLIMPNRQHLYYNDTYFIRRLWDYFVEHLLGEVPPKNYLISGPSYRAEPSS